ncbi:hypothetical protein HHI36_015613 [Cryptolaemus montrouzieri]|uniref:Dynein heavy chain tail domain-containing protein n=1 Tax=Cryptolaemus montrouzieri TaxID=559131 RepID=A0ABD2N6Y1_9CUCU
MSSILNTNLGNVLKLYFQEQLSHQEKYGQFILDKYMPPVAGSLRWMNSLCTRLNTQIDSFKTLQHPITQSQEAKDIYEKNEIIQSKIRDLQSKLFLEWIQVIPDQIEKNMKESLFKRDIQTKKIRLNFNPQLSAILREVHYLKLIDQDGIPEKALELEEKNETMRKFTEKLNSTITWYNKIRKTTRDVEYNLIATEISNIDSLIDKGQTQFSWNSQDIWDYMVNLHGLVENLQSHLEKSKTNLEEIRNALIPYARQPLFERRDGRKDTCLHIESREERVAKRFSEIKQEGDRIRFLLNENMHIFKMDQNACDPKWQKYIDYIDDIVFNYLYQCVGCR